LATSSPTRTKAPHGTYRPRRGKGEEKKEGEGKLGEWRYGCWGIDPLGIGGAKAKECEGMEGERERDRRKGAGRGG